MTYQNFPRKMLAPPFVLQKVCLAGLVLSGHLLRYETIASHSALFNMIKLAPENSAVKLTPEDTDAKTATEDSPVRSKTENYCTSFTSGESKCPPTVRYGSWFDETNQPYGP
ncbi:hypothetical protein PMIN04_008532 [Paraphaeosphaeria minitans]